jgi:threonine/homoserine/homoserine lactone efflux protein
MKEALLQGLLTGLIISTFTGPIFFMLVDLGVRGQMKAGINLALGTFISDILSVIFIYFVASNIVTNKTIMDALYLVGGIILIVVGLKQIAKQKSDDEEPPALTKKERRKLFMKGFLVNSSNPNVFFFWLGAVVIAIQAYDNKLSFIMGHFLVALSLVLVTDCLKMYVAARLRPLLKGNSLLYISKIAGVIIVFFGVKLIFFH